MGSSTKVLVLVQPDNEEGKDQINKVRDQLETQHLTALWAKPE
jgi:hypothetical protein